MWNLKVFILCITKQHWTVLYLSGVHPDLDTRSAEGDPKNQRWGRGSGCKEGGNKPGAGHRDGTSGWEEVPGKRGEKGYKEKKHQKELDPFSHSSLYSLPLAAWFQRCTHLSTQPSRTFFGGLHPWKVTSWFPIPNHKEIPKTFHTLLSSSSPSDKPSTSPANEIYSWPNAPSRRLHNTFKKLHIIENFNYIPK